MKTDPLYHEQSILLQVAEGDQHAFALIFNRYSGKVYGFAHKLTRSEELAEEVVQEVFLKLWLNREKLKDIDVFGAWLNRVNRNCCLDMIRRIEKETKVRNELGFNHAQISHDTENNISLRATQQAIARAMKDLTPQQQRVYQLCQIDGFKYEEAARELNVAYSTIHSHMKAALKIIRLHLGDATAILFLAELFHAFKK